MTCTGNCLQGRRCTCWQRDHADKRAYQAHSSCANWLSVALIVLLVAIEWASCVTC